MENNWNQLIGRYLNNELSAEGKEAFEAELAKNKDLQQELELHQLTQDLVRRTAIRTIVVQRGKFLKLKKTLTTAGVTLVVLAAITAAALYFSRPTNTSESTTESDAPIEKVLLDKMEKELGFNNIDVQYFKFTGKNDVFLSASGVLLSITNNSFLLNGKPYQGEAVVQWQEAQKAADIVKAGLSTTSGDKLLETQGMFSLNAFTPDGKQLTLSDKGVYVQVPVNENKKGMMLFNGVEKNGAIDWQNPVALEKLPTPKSMADIDLFPPKYEPKLNELKWFTDKEKRDSLYLSFEEGYCPECKTNHTTLKDSANVNKSRPAMSTEPININWESSLSAYPSDQKLRGELLYKNKCATCHSPHKDGTGPALSGVRKRWEKGGAKPASLYNWVANQAQAASKDPYALNILNSRPATMPHFPELKGKLADIDAIFDYIDSQPFPYEESDMSRPKKHIPPSKVLAIWNKKFDNTILATVDFEKRMKAIHNTCDERVFDIYVKGINEPLWKLDEKVVKLGYKEFQQFADEKVGKLELANEHQKNLKDFYDTSVKALREKGKNAVMADLKKQRDWDDEMVKVRSDETLRKGLRESANLNEEYGFNLRNVYKQLGKTVGFEMHGGGTIVNIDKYVWDATVARKSTLITDPETGKTAQITYNSVKLSVEDAKHFNKLFVYLFSKEINSFQRLDVINGKLDYNLNGDMTYSAAIVGMNEKEFYYREIPQLKAGDLGQFTIVEISESEFDKKINALNAGRTEKPMDLKDELSWLFKEKANYKVQKQRRENEAFRMTIWPTIYSCGVSEMIPEPSEAEAVDLIN